VPATLEALRTAPVEPAHPGCRIDRAPLEKKGERGVQTIDAKFLHYKEY